MCFLLHGQSQEVLAGVDVPIVMSAAVRTRPIADMWGFLAVPMSAGGTDLAGRIESVRLDEHPSFPFGFVCQLPAEFEPTDIPNRFRKFVVLHQVAATQRFDHDDLVFVRDFVGELVQKMLALVRNLFVFLGQHQACLIPVLAAFLFAAQGPLSFLDFLFGLVQIFWVRMLHGFPGIVCGDGEVGNAEIDADFVFSRQPLRRFLFDQNGNEIITGLVHGKGAGLDQAREVPVLLNFDETNLRQFDFAVFDADVPALVIGGVGGI